MMRDDQDAFGHAIEDYWLYASQEDMWRIVRGTGWWVQEFIDDGTGAFVGVLRKDGQGNATTGDECAISCIV